jgi:geranylgeranyl pyrophosphate synthase
MHAADTRRLDGAIRIVARLVRQGRAVDAALLDLLSDECGVVGQAMRYAALSPGKRLRPLLVLESCRAVGGRPSRALSAACAVELVHAMSLVHDDLPCMDDADLRRGRPATHRVFGEAVAVLAGDALLARAMVVVALSPGPPDRRLRAVATLGQALGCQGLAGGQARELELRGSRPSEVDLVDIARRKTGALFRASSSLGAVMAGATADDRAVLGNLGEAFGLALQLVDDANDAEGRGKPAGQDVRHGQTTHAMVLGVRGARERAEVLLDAALQPVEERFGARAAGLALLADRVLG